MSALRVGMIGTGWIAQRIADDLRLVEGLDLVAVTARDEGRSRAFAERFGLTATASVSELLARDVDVVYIATPPSSHFPIARQCLEAGTSVVIEKVFTETFEQAALLVDLARRRGLFLMEAMWTRFNPVIRTVAERVAAGSLGEARTLVATAGFAALPDHRLWSAETGGGCLLDQSIYPIVLADLMLGPVIETTARASFRGYDDTPVSVDTELAVTTGHPNGRTTLFSNSIRSSLACRAELACTEGRVELPTFFWNPPEAVLFRAGSDPEILRIDRRGHGYVDMLDGVADALRSGWQEHHLCTHEMTLRTMRQIDTIRKTISEPTVRTSIPSPVVD